MKIAQISIRQPVARHQPLKLAAVRVRAFPQDLPQGLQRVRLPITNAPDLVPKLHALRLHEKCAKFIVTRNLLTAEQIGMGDRRNIIATFIRAEPASSVALETRCGFTMDRGLGEAVGINLLSGCKHAGIGCATGIRCSGSLNGVTGGLGRSKMDRADG